jgi:hypothetical protein
MAQLQIGSTCDEGIYVNSTNNYTMIKLPTGDADTAGFNKDGFLFFDTKDREITFYDENTNRYQIPKVNFTVL